MIKSNHPFFEAVKSSPEISEKLDELYRIPHENHDERINQIENMLNALRAQPDHPNKASATIQFERMLETTREEQDEANPNQKKL